LKTHKFLDYPVKDDSVVITILDMRDEILHRLRCNIGIQLEENVALGGMYRGGSGGRAGLFDHLHGSALLFSGRPLVKDVSVASFGLAATVS
jgi:hypothetical protein